MNYQPDLFVFNIGNSTPKTIYNVIHELGLGKIQYIEIVDGEHAFIAMDEWHMNRTISTRIKLNQGRPLLLHHTETNYWKVYSYENRYIEEMKKEKEQKEQKEKEQKEQKEQKEIEQKLKERELKMQLLKKEYQEIIMKKEKIYKEKLALEKLIKEKENRQPKYKYYDDDDDDEEDTTTSEDYSDIDSDSNSNSNSEIGHNRYNNTIYDVDDYDGPNFHIDYGDDILELYPIIKSHIEKRFACKTK